VPTVSVVIPAYNQGHFLGAAIGSVLTQTYSDVEVLVVDDGSTDDTRAVASAVTDDRVRYLYQPNQGLSAARNTGIRHARGAYLTYLDSDDQFLPDKLALLLDAFERTPELGFCAGQAVLVGDDGEPLGEVFDRGLPSETSGWLLGNPLHVGSVLIRREWQERAGLFDERLRSYEDWDMWLRLAGMGCPMGWVSRPVSRYRFHSAQMTRIGQQMTTASFAVLDKVFATEALPSAWRARRAEAYSRASLRAAAQAYTAGEFNAAAGYMRDAVSLQPELLVDEAEPLARLIAGWANHVKTGAPLPFLSAIYEHLPEELSVLSRRRNADLAREALHLAALAHRRGASSEVRDYVRHAIGHRPGLMLDRRVLTLLLGALVGRGAAAGGDRPIRPAGTNGSGHALCRREV
jgi:Glycosyl transferase family 2